MQRRYCEDARCVTEMKGRPKNRWLDTANNDLKRWRLKSEDTDDQER